MAIDKPLSTNIQPASANLAQFGDTLLDLLIIAYRPKSPEIIALNNSISNLPANIRFSVAVNSAQSTLNSSLDHLLAQAHIVQLNTENLGYGRAANRLFNSLSHPAPWLAVLNTDLHWQPGSFENLLCWLLDHPEVVAAAPQILSPSGQIERLTKLDPSLLSLFSRRFVPQCFKPNWLCELDNRFLMMDYDINSIYDVPYLSGCALFVRSSAYKDVGGFDPAYFLYLEDADLTRRLRSLGRCVHLPVAQITHGWGRGSHRSLWLTLVNLWSAVIYFRRWGLKLWN
jgi:GT2 family glycosyltransferase